jgi:hypothetical protein
MVVNQPWGEEGQGLQQKVTQVEPWWLSCGSSRELRPTLDEGLKYRVQWNRAVLFSESHKLDPQPIDEGPRPKKWQIVAKPTWRHFGGQINWFGPRQRAQKESLWFGAPRCKARVQGRLQTQGFNFASNESKFVPRNLDPGPHLKWALEL